MENYQKEESSNRDLFEELLRRSLELSPGDRAMLADLLMQSLAANDQNETDEAWADEIERRIKAIDEGRVELIPGEEVLARLRSRFK
jgi:putative addiction module component (TIGR02574 family)